MIIDFRKQNVYAKEENKYDQVRFVKHSNGFTETDGMKVSEESDRHGKYPIVTLRCITLPQGHDKWNLQKRIYQTCKDHELKTLQDLLCKRWID